MTLSQFWQFYQQIERSIDRSYSTQTTPDLEDVNRARLKTNEVKSQALLGRFIQQSNQNNLYRVISTAHSQKVAPTMKSHWMNSTNHFEEVEKIQHLVRIRFDTRISRT